MGYAARLNQRAIDRREGRLAPKPIAKPKTLYGYVWPTDVLMKTISKQLGYVTKAPPKPVEVPPMIDLEDEKPSVVLSRLAEAHGGTYEMPPLGETALAAAQETEQA